jgi:cyanophycinase-like exopeptidase
MGGTSAGLAILGDYDFAALNGGIGSGSALANPYDSRITLDGTFVNARDYVATVGGSTSLSMLDNTITDPHFEQRDRMGRLLTFLARLDADGLVSKGAERGIGINEQTALLIDPAGVATVVGNPYSKKLDPAVQQRSVYLLSATKPADSPLHTPLDFSKVDVILAKYDPISGKGDTFDLTKWKGTGTESYSLSVSAGVIQSTQSNGSIY